MKINLDNLIFYFISNLLAGSFNVQSQKFKKLSVKHDFDLVWAQSNGNGSITNVFTDEFLSKVRPWFLAHIYGGIYWAATGLGIDK